MTARNASINQWVSFPHLRPQAQLRLFCFPYAGGNSLIYRKWPEALPITVEVCSVELPGRGNRLRDPPFNRIMPLVRALATELSPYLDKPFAFFGHSMGALISFELARQLRREQRQLPAHLFVSGHSAPQVKDAEPRTFDLPQAQFIEELSNLNGTPREVFEQPELMNMLIPLLRADFAVSQAYEYVGERPLDCPLSAFGGLQDVFVPREQLTAWRTQTTTAFNLLMFPGDHFFLQTAQASLLQAISLELERLLIRTKAHSESL